MKIGIIGPERSGKTTVFQCITGLIGQPSSGKAATLGVVQVPDPRLEVLAGMYNPRKTTPAEIVFVDLGQAGTQSDRLSAITGALSDADALAVVCGAFLEDDPTGVLESFLLDLTLADLSVVENRLERIEKDVQRGKKDARAEEPLMQRLQAALAAGRRVADVPVGPEEAKALRGYQFVTAKPSLVVANVAESDLGNGVGGKIAAAAQASGLSCFEMCGTLELEISQLPEEDRDPFLSDYGIDEPARGRFIRSSYGLTDLVSFLTAGPDEVRAWSIRRGTLAPSAAGKIHSDIEQGFIRAEVVAYNDLMAAGTMAECRAQGKVRLEGKQYEVQDGDIIDFRFSV